MKISQISRKFALKPTHSNNPDAWKHWQKTKHFQHTRWSVYTRRWLKCSALMPTGILSIRRSRDIESYFSVVLNQPTMRCWIMEQDIFSRDDSRFLHIMQSAWHRPTEVTSSDLRNWTTIPPSCQRMYAVYALGIWPGHLYFRPFNLVIPVYENGCVQTA